MEHPTTIQDPQSGRDVLMTWRQRWGRLYWSADGDGYWYPSVRLALDDGRRRGVLWFRRQPTGRTEP